MFYAKVFLLFVLTTVVFAYGLEETPYVGIIGGMPVPISDAPYMASLRLNGYYHWCGASIIHKRFVLTAAHCIRPNRKYKVAVGTESIYASTGGLYGVEKIIPHQRYSNITYDYDICLVKLDKDIAFGPNVSKIQPADTNTKLKSGMTFNAYGWGLTQPEGNVSTVLRQVSVPFVKRRECQIYYIAKNKITMRMFCAGASGKDTCTADSGGPLVWRNVQVGITSLGASCGVGPAIYTKISILEPWIRHTIGNNI